LLISGVSALAFFIMAVIAAFGMAVIVVEKGDEWPAKLGVGPIRFLLSLIYPKFAEMFDCPVCTAFWTGLIADFVIFLISGYAYFLWPLTGFAASGMAWLAYELLGVLDDGDSGDETE